MQKGLAISLGLALGAAWAGIVWQANHAERPHVVAVRALSIVPAGPAFVLTVDVARLRASAVGQALIGRGVAGLGADACESALARAIDELVIALPAGGEVGRPGLDSFAVIVSGSFRAATVLACAEAHLRTRHGDPVRATIGSFSSVRDRRQAAEVAARDGLLILSDGAYLRELLDAGEGHRADGSPAERERDLLHTELRRVVGRGAPVIATLALPSGWLGAALGDPAAELSPLSALRSAALRAELATGVDVAGLIACDAVAPCEHLERFLGEARADLGSLLPPDAAALLGRLTVTRKGARIELSAHLSADDIGRPSLAPSASSAPAR